MELFETSDAAFSYACRSVSKEEQKYQRDCFNEVFVPILLENGFLKKGTRYYRLYENRFLQIVEFARWGALGTGARWYWLHDILSIWPFRSSIEI